MIDENNKEKKIIIPLDEWEKNREKFERLHNKNCNFLIDLENPRTLSDKTTFCDIYFNFNKDLFFKDTAKLEVAKILNTTEYCVPTYQICKNVEEIDWQNLIGKSFVIKPDNKAMSRGVFIQKRLLKKKDIEEFKQKVKQNKYLQSTNCIVVEKFIGAKNRKQDFMIDYKFWCFNGKPYCVLIIDGRDVITHKKQSNFYDMNFKKMKLQKANDLPLKKRIRKPKNWEKMIEIATKISKDIPCIRVDLYNVGGKIWFGECQHIYSFHCKFSDMKFNETLANLLDIITLKKQVDKYKKQQIYTLKDTINDIVDKKSNDEYGGTTEIRTLDGYSPYTLSRGAP